MFFKSIRILFGDRNDRILRNMENVVDKINHLEYSISILSDQQLKDKTLYFKNCLKKNILLEDLLPEAFAVVRECSKRVFKMRHFDVQLLGGIVLHNNCISEMNTGEGKTLTSTLSIYLNALEGRGVHVVTINEYLAKRDYNKNKILFNFLGLTVGINLSSMTIEEKKKSYCADITYGTSSEFCFDYLRDNMVYNKNDRVQKKLYYVLIDEIDSILIDESITPLIISGISNSQSNIYIKINSIINNFIQQKQEDSDIFHGDGDFFICNKYKQIILTTRGFIKIEQLLIKYNFLKSYSELYSIQHIDLIHYILSALRAHFVLKKNVDYIVKNRQVIIIDENTGRMSRDRRWSYGLHQSIEAKENLMISYDNQVLASMTLQNYFKLYKKMSGMTGTAITESFEFNIIYNLNTVVIPTNRPMIRDDMPDLFFLNQLDKNNAIIQDIKTCYMNQQPVLIGTDSIKNSEILSKKLNDLGIKHNVLHAKLYKQEATIISKSGKLKSITIATNMAGRGTDIVLGGLLKDRNSFLCFSEYNKHYQQWKKNHDRVVQVGGLHVIGTEKYKSRRIDNQLRGRAGRQGDPGSSKFYVSLEDSLVCMFIPSKIKDSILNFLTNMKTSIESSWISIALSNAQKKIENQHFEMRRQLLDYDNILNDQRCIIYFKRNNIININNIKCIIFNQIKHVILNIINTNYISNIHFFKKGMINIEKILLKDWNFKFHPVRLIKDNFHVSSNIIFNSIFKTIEKRYEFQETKYSLYNINKIIKSIMLYNLDVLWREHLSSMEYLRQGINLRRYAQKNPKQEYKIESFNMFCNMLNILKYDIVSQVMKKFLFIDI